MGSAVDPQTGEVALLLHRLRKGDSFALSELAPLMDKELRRLAEGHLRKQPPGHAWEAADLVNELWLRLLGRGVLQFENPAHFLGASAHLMRVMVIDHARAQSALKRRPERGEAFPNVVADDHLLQRILVEKVLSELAAVDPRRAEVVELRYLAGLSVEEVAGALEISAATVKREWEKARAWLCARIRGEEE